jgi:hypothetical protein
MGQPLLQAVRVQRFIAFGRRGIQQAVAQEKQTLRSLSLHFTSRRAAAKDG